MAVAREVLAGLVEWVAVGEPAILLAWLYFSLFFFPDVWPHFDEVQGPYAVKYQLLPTQSSNLFLILQVGSRLVVNIPSAEA